MKKPCAEDDSSSPFLRLPDDLLLQIFNKIMDLKTLCTCQLVSRRLSSIVLQIDSVSVTLSSKFDLNECNDELLRLSRRLSILVAMDSIGTFSRLKSLHIHFPFLNTTGNLNFKWKIQVSNRLDSFVFVSPNSIHSTNTNTDNLLCGVDEGSLQHDEEENAELSSEKFIIAFNCFMDVVCRLMLFRWTDDLPLLEYVCITDSGKWGTVCCNSSGKISQVRDMVKSEDAQEKLLLLENHDTMLWCYVPLLKLPVSGYVMMGVTMILAVRDDLPDDSVINIDDDMEDGIELDKEEAAYREAMIEIFKKHSRSIQRVPLV